MRILSRVTALVAFTILSFGTSHAASMVAVVTNGIGPGGTTMPVSLGIAQAGQFFYAYDPATCASLTAPTISTQTAPAGGSLSTATATVTITGSNPCSGQTVTGVSVTYTPTAGVPDAGALLVQGGNYWQCGINGGPQGIAGDPNDCAQREAAYVCNGAVVNNVANRDCLVGRCVVSTNNNPTGQFGYAQCSFSYRHYYNVSGGGYFNAGAPYDSDGFRNLPATCGSDFATSASASGCVGAAPLILPSNLDPTLPDSYAVTATSADGASSVTSSMTTTPSGKDLGDCKCSTGDPVSIGTGNMHDTVVDYTTAGQNPLSYTRYYNSQALGASFASTLGTGWRSNYDRYLHMISATNVAAERSDGKVLQFLLVNGVWVTDPDNDMQLTQSGATWTLTDHEGTVETYSAAIANGTNSGNTGLVLASIKRRNGYTQTMGYNAAHQLATITDSYGRILSLTYAGTQVQTVTTPDSTIITYGYTGALLTSVTYSGTPATSIGYSYTNNLLTTVTDELGQPYGNWVYDSYGRATSSSNGSGNARLTTFVYNADGSRTVTSPLGLVETYKFINTLGSLKLSEVDRAASSTTAAATRLITYDDNGYLSTSADWLGNTTSYLNDPHGNVTQLTDALNRTTTISYDSAFTNLPDSIIAPAITTGFTYDGMGEVLTRTDTDATGNSTNGQTRTWTYTWLNSLLNSVQMPRSDVVVKTIYGYDASGAQTSTTDSLGHVTSVTSHTGGGRPLTVSDPNGVVTTLSYDGRQRLTSSSVATSAGALQTSWNYDAAGNLIQLTLPDNSYTGWSYDSAHRIVGMTDNAADTITYTLDNAGNATATTIAGAAGPVTASSSAIFDAIGRKLSETPAGSGQASSWTYDVQGNVKTKTDGLGHQSTGYTYDAANRLTQWTTPDTSTLGYAYDMQDHVTGYLTQQNLNTTYKFDAWGEVLSYNPTVSGGAADDGGMTYLRDGDGNITKRTDFYGTTIQWTFDSGDRPLTKTFSTDTAENVAYTYDQTGSTYGFGIGHLTKMVDQAGTLSRTYDERGNVLSDSRITAGGRGHQYSFITNHTYDAAGRVSSVTYPSGLITSYVRNALGQITQVNMGPQPVVSAVTYLPFGPAASLTYGNGVTEILAHDYSYRATGVVDTGAAGALSSLSYTLDAADNVTTITDGVNAANSQGFTYNLRDRLLTATGAYGAYTWTYDYNGNRSSEMVGSNAATAYSYANDRVSQVGSTTLGYTAGVIATVTPASGPASSFTINKADRLASASIGGVGVESYIYDGAGALFSRSPTGAAYQYQYDLDGKLLSEFTNSLPQADYIYLGTRPVAVHTAPGIISYLHDDRLGTPVLATDVNQAVVWSASYLPFGQASVTGSITQNLRLPGQFAGSISGRYHNGWRDYNPAIGRYEEADPINRWGSFNVYAYAEGNPLKLVDRNGLQVEEDPEEDPMEAPPGESMSFPLAESLPAQSLETPESLINPPATQAGTCELPGIVYLRTDNTGKLEPYIGQSITDARYSVRQIEHARDYQDSDFDFSIIDRANPGTDLDVAEHQAIQYMTGNVRAGRSPLVSNQRDPVGAARRSTLGLPEPNDQ